MRLLSIAAAIALGGLALTGCATSGVVKSSAVGTSSKAGWGPHGKPLYLFMVMSNATKGQEDEFNRWYDRIHAPIVIEKGDFVWTQRFELSPKQFAGNGTPELMTRQYMVIFALETDDLEGSLKEVNARLALPRNVRSTALDYSTLKAVSWKALGPQTSQKEAQRMLAEETAAGNVPKEGAPAPPGGVPPGAVGGPGSGGPPPGAAPPAQ